MGIKGQTMGCTFLFTEDHPDVSIPALEYAGFGSVPYTTKWQPQHNKPQLQLHPPPQPSNNNNNNKDNNGGQVSPLSPFFFFAFFTHPH
jgi:hypothetical protein